VTLKTLPLLGLCVLFGCGSSHNQESTGLGGSGGGAGGNPAGGHPAGGAAGTRASATGGSDASTDSGLGSPPTAADLQGAWYALNVPRADGGSGAIAHQRIRFAGSQYFLVWNGPGTYCAEVGTFQLQGSSIAFDVSSVEGFGPCVQGPPRTETVRRSGAGIALQGQRGDIAYLPIRGVPKVFATVETHNGAFSSDATLTGTDAIAKADAFCDQSIAKPDSGHYHAMLWDDVNRQRSGATNATLLADTTYFQADGVRNVFTTDSRGSGTANQPVLADDPQDFLYFWVGNGCAGWTSADASATAPAANAAQPTLGGVSGACNELQFGVLCAGTGTPINGALDGLDGGTMGDGGNDQPSVLQGGWRRAAEPSDAGAAAADHERLRFDGDRYDLVSVGAYGYCAEVGTFRAASGSIRFAPEREVGWGPCLIGDIRTATLAVSGSELTLAFGGSSTRYTAAPAVPKFFIPTELHDGDFADDSTLSGGNAVAKADALCNGSVARPDQQAYKAVLIDGVNRTTTLDWVLKPATTYYQADGALPVLTTNAQGLYDTSTPFTNGYLPGYGGFQVPWTGFNFDLTPATDNCQRWSSLASNLAGRLGALYGSFGSSVTAACANRETLICASQ